MEFLISILLGMIPEVVYYYLMLKNLLEIKTKKFKLFMFIIILYFITVFAINYNIYLYIIFDIGLYLVMKKLYKSKITDFFLLIFLEVYLYLTSFICFFCIKNYIIAFIIQRILLFIPLILKNKVKNLYNIYKLMWNRNDKKNYPIKSLTLRNISVVIINTILIMGYLTLLYILKITN